MWDFSITKVGSMLLKTLPFLLFRAAVYFSVTLITIVATGTGAGVGWLAGTVAGDAPSGAGWGGMIALGIVGTALYLAREYLLYQVKAGHIAVLVRLMEGQPVPEGKQMVTYAQEQVKQRFTQSSTLFALDQLIKAILKTFNRALNSIARFIPVEGMKVVINFLNAVINMSLTYVDEIILAYSIRSGGENPWEDSRKALVLYAQNYQNILKNALFLTFFVWALTLVVFIIALTPMAIIVSLFPGTAGFWAFVFALVFAWSLKAAIIEPFAMMALMDVYFKAIEGQTPDAEWEAKLEEMSEQFVELKEKASNWVFSTDSADKPEPTVDESTDTAKDESTEAAKDESTETVKDESTDVAKDESTEAAKDESTETIIDDSTKDESAKDESAKDESAKGVTA